MKDINSYSKWTVKQWFSTPTDPKTGKKKVPGERDLSIMTLGLAGETGEVMEILKKRIRDDHFDKEHFIKELGDVAFYWARMCAYFDIKPSDVLAANIKKLKDRRARGTQRGSGNDR